MAVLVDTSVWSLAFRRDSRPEGAEVAALRAALAGEHLVVGTGIIFLELLRGFVPPRTQSAIESAFDALTLLEPTREDYIAAAALSNTCRSSGVQLATIDALLAQLCISNDLVLLTTDADLRHAARHIPLRVWSP